MSEPTPTVSRLQRGALPVLVLVSGFCGISYEILYTRLLGNLLGNQFTINATVLLTFLLGIGVGTLYAHRFARWLWAIELGIGAYAAVLALAYPLIDAVLYDYLPFLGTNIYTAAATSLILLALPAFLIGCSVPLFAAYLGSIHPKSGFSRTYGIYNVGAALTALAMEFALVRWVGLRGATLLTAVLNVGVAIALVRMALPVPTVPVPSVGKQKSWRFPKSVLAALAVVSVVSAVFQLLMIKLAEFVFGPYNETFALVLATVLLCIALGAMAAGRLGLTFPGALLLSLGGLAWILIALSRVVDVYAGLYESVAPTYPLLVLLKFGLVFALMGPAAIGFGATVPVLLGKYKDVAKESGQLLFVSSMGNTVGFILMAFVLHRFMDYGPLIVGMIAVLALTLLIHHGLRQRTTVIATGLIAVAALGYTGVWNEMLLYVGHLSFRSSERLEEQLSSTVIADRYKGAEDVFAITWVDDVPYFFLNGFISIPLGGEKATEEVVGALSAMHAPRLDRAMVLGMGSGTTAGTVGLIFEETDVVEINNVILQHLDLLSPYNFDIQSQSGVNIVHDDGIHFIRTMDTQYSMILNTVTSPQFFNSSKLYTQDFFEHVKARLTDDGVYVTWIDGTIGDSGVDIILDSLDASFEDCWLNYLTGTYYFLVCSDDNLALHQAEAVAANSVLNRYLVNEYALPLSLLPYSVLSTDALDLRSDPGSRTVAINRIDHPVLEFEMAQLANPEAAFLRGFGKRLEQRVDLDTIQADLGGPDRWSRGAFAFFGDVRAEPGWDLDRILRSIVDRHGLSSSDLEDYDRAAQAFAQDVGTANAYVLAGRALMSRDRFGAVAALLADPPEADSSEEASELAWMLGSAETRLKEAGSADSAEAPQE